MEEKNDNHVPEETPKTGESDNTPHTKPSYNNAQGAQPNRPQSRTKQQEQRGELPNLPQSPFVPEREQENLQEDVAQILREAKIPERRDVPSEKTKPDPAPHSQQPPESGPAQQQALPRTPQPLQKSEAPLQRARVDKINKQQPGKRGETEQKQDPVVSSLRTFKHDLQKLARSEKMSLTKAATLEAEKKRKREGMLSKTDRRVKRRGRKRLLNGILIIVVLIALGGLALFTIFVVQSQRSQDIAVADETSLLFSEQTFAFPIEDQPRELLLQLSRARTSTGLTLGAITRIVPTVPEINPKTGVQTERPATATEFFNAIDSRIPEELLRALAPNFFLGVHTINENVPFFVIPVAAYERAFASMLSWETNINTDLSPFFTQVRRQIPRGDGIIIREFEDIIVRNFDVRALRDENGEVKMLYSFPTREVLIIAESPHSFVEALARLRAERRL